MLLPSRPGAMVDYAAKPPVLIMRLCQHNTASNVDP